MRRAIHTSTLFSLVIVAAGCSDDELPAIRYETERAVIGTDFDEPLCGRDLSFVDERIVFVEDYFGDVEPRTHEIYLYRDVERLPCRGGFGCYSRNDGYIATLWPFLDHELVHSVARSVPFPSLFWEEGAAEALRVRGTRKIDSDLLTGDGLAAESGFHYGTAGHFVRFLMETHGYAPVVRALNSEPLEEVFGLSADDLARSYEQSAPFAYPAMHPCPYPEIVETPQGTWEHRLVVSCESPEATQFDWEGASVIRTLTLVDDGEYDLTVRGGEGVTFIGCHTEILNVPLPDLAHGDVHSEAEFETPWFGHFFESETPHSLFLTQGTYRVGIAAGRDEDTEIEFVLRRR